MLPLCLAAISYTIPLTPQRKTLLNRTLHLFINSFNAAFFIHRFFIGILFARFALAFNQSNRAMDFVSKHHPFLFLGIHRVIIPRPFKTFVVYFSYLFALSFFSEDLEPALQTNWLPNITTPPYFNEGQYPISFLSL